MPGFIPGAPRQYVGMANNTGAGLFPYVGINANRAINMPTGYIPVPMTQQPFVPSVLQAQAMISDTMTSNIAAHVTINEVDGDSTMKKMVHVRKLDSNPFNDGLMNYFKLNTEVDNSIDDYQLTAYYQDDNTGHVYALVSLPTTLQANNGTTIKVINRTNQKMVLVGVNCVKSKYIVIPAYVYIDNDNDNAISVGDNIYAIGEMWGCNLYGTTAKNTTAHWIQPSEYETDTTQVSVLYTIDGGKIIESDPIVTSIPYSFYAPFLEKIDFSHVSNVSHARFFSDMGCFTNFYMPSLVEIMSKDVAYPDYGKFLCNALINRLSLPALTKVKNMYFCKGCSRLRYFVASNLEELVETVFLQNCSMIEVLALGSLHKIYGCDYFCNGCSALKYLRLPCNLSLRAHANKQSNFQIDLTRWRRSNTNINDPAGSGAMVGFLGGCVSLSNAHKDNTSCVIDADLYNANRMSMEYRMPQFRGIELIMNGKFLDYGRWFTSSYTGDQVSDPVFQENVWSGAYLKNGAYANDSLTPAAETITSANNISVSLNIARTNENLIVLFGADGTATTGAALDNTSIWVPVDYRTALDNTLLDHTTVRDRLYVIQVPYITFNTDAATSLVTETGKGVTEAATPVTTPAGKSVAALIDGFMKLCLGFNQLY